MLANDNENHSQQKKKKGCGISATPSLVVLHLGSNFQIFDPVVAVELDFQLGTIGCGDNEFPHRNVAAGTQFAGGGDFEGRNAVKGNGSHVRTSCVIDYEDTTGIDQGSLAFCYLRILVEYTLLLFLILT